MSAKGRSLLNMLGLFPLEIISRTNCDRSFYSGRTARRPCQQIVLLPQDQRSHGYRISGMQAREGPLDHRAMQSRISENWNRRTINHLERSELDVRFEPAGNQRYFGE